MALTDMVVFDTQLKSAIVERLTQYSTVFNEASNNALSLRNASNMGDFREESFWDNVGGAIRDVNRYVANGAQASTPLTQDIMRTVKAAKGFGPILWEPGQITWIQENPSVALRVISESLAQAMLEAQVNRAIGVANAAIGNVAALTYDDTGAGTPTGVTQSNLNRSHALFGDRSQELVTQVMTGTAYHQLIGNALDNANELFSEGTVRVVDILGKRSVVTDAPALNPAGTTQHILTLTPNAATIEPNNDYVQNIETTNGNERIETTFQADWSENVGVKGYAWNDAIKSPITGQLNTGTNWVQNMDDKNTAGVLLIADTADNANPI